MNKDTHGLIVWTQYGAHVLRSRSEVTSIFAITELYLIPYYEMTQTLHHYCMMNTNHSTVMAYSYQIQ